MVKYVDGMNTLRLTRYSAFNDGMRRVFKLMRVVTLCRVVRVIISLWQYGLSVMERLLLPSIAGITTGSVNDQRSDSAIKLHILCD